MPRARRNTNSLAVVETQVGRMQQALAKLQVEIARLLRMQERSQPRLAGQPPKTLQEARQAAEHQFILEIGQECGWSRTRMARLLKIDRKSLYRRMHKYGMATSHPVSYGPPPRKVSKPARAAKGRRHR